MIILYNPWSTPSRKKPLPMSLLAAASLLEGEHECQIIDGNLIEDPVAHIMELGANKRIDALGITVMPGPQLCRAVRDSLRLKTALGDTPVVWGGYFPSQHADVVLKEAYVDFCVRSQGEQAFSDLVDALRKGGDLSSIPGLSYKENGRIRHNPPQPLIPLDDLPDWPYHKLPMENYFHKHYLGNRVGAHQSSFGCPFSCNFCAVVAMSNRRWVAQSAERVAKIMKHQRDKYGADAVQFHDMDFFVSGERTAEFAERIAHLGMHWWALGRVDALMRLCDDTWRKLKSSGLKMVFSGAESGSDETLRLMNKGGKASACMTVELAKRMKHYGIVPEFSFVMGNPPDPLSDIEETFMFIRRLKETNQDAEIVIYIYTPVPQEGALLDEARRLDFRFPDSMSEWTSRNWRSFSLRREPHTPWMDARVGRQVRNFESVLNAYFPTVTDMKMHGFRRSLLRILGGWRYHARIYACPIELRTLQRLIHYQRPETAGF